MTTLEAPITPCPAWCPEAGHHEWAHTLDSSRLHERHVLVAPTRFKKSIVVSATVYETPTDSEPLVELENADALFSRSQVEQVIAAMREASDLAFGPSPVAEQQAEFDAAAAELINRAGNPLDVNRLIAAAIRLRRAHNALCDAEASL